MTNYSPRELLSRHIKDKNNIFHSLETEVIMRALANYLHEDEGVWGNLGLLHDIDWEYGAATHGIKSQEILKAAGYNDEFISTVSSHCYGNDDCGLGIFKNKVRQTKVQHALAAAETITGLIFATALVQPDKKLSSVKVSSIRKKIKDRSFAAKVDRRIIVECEKLGLKQEEFIVLALKAMQGIAKEINL